MSYIYLNGFLLFFICNLGIKLHFRSGKSSPCTLFRGNFPGAKLVYIVQIVYLVHLTCETGEINMFI